MPEMRNSAFLRRRRRVDYGREDFCESGRQYDLVLDLVGNQALRELRRVLKSSKAIVFRRRCLG